MSYCCMPSKLRSFVKRLDLVKCKKKIGDAQENNDEDSLFTATAEDPFVMLPNEPSVTILEIELSSEREMAQIMSQFNAEWIKILQISMYQVFTRNVCEVTEDLREIPLSTNAHNGTCKIRIELWTSFDFSKFTRLANMSAAQKQFFLFIRDFSIRSSTISVRTDSNVSVAYVPLYYPKMSFHVLEKELVKAIPMCNGKLSVVWERIMRDAKVTSIATIAVDPEVADQVRRAVNNMKLKAPHDVQVILYEELDDTSFDDTMEYQKN
jgi:hypothetical protein